MSLFEQLQSDVNNAAALRVRTRLEPAGGEGDKIFPVTHDQGAYAWEERVIDGERRRCVLLNSVQAEANLHELAMLENAEAIGLPLIVAEIPGERRITSLEAPHRAFDAIFRDCELDGKEFYDSEVGKALVGSNEKNATSLLEYCPNSLIWGAWDSRHAGMASVRAARIARAMTSEIVGMDALEGKRTASRLDPLGIPRSVGETIYRSPDQRHWAFEKQPGWTQMKSLTDVGHSNIPPSINEGGVTVRYALQTTVLSYGQLRRLGFGNADRDLAARVLLAALAAHAMTLRKRAGYRLRSRCDLVPLESKSETVGPDGARASELEETQEAVEQAVDAAKKAGFRWGEQTTLTASEKLLKLLQRGREVKSDAGV